MTVSHWVRTLARGEHRCDVAVLGGGVAGLSAAIRLAERSVDALVLDRHRAGAGASTRNAGFLMRGADVNYARAIQRWGRETAREAWKRSEENLRALLALGAGELSTFQRIPSCLIALGEEERGECERSLKLLRDDGFEAGWVDAGDDSLWASRLPLGGLVNPNDGAVNPAELIAHIASRVGDRIVPNAEVFALRSDGDGVDIESGAGVVRAQRVICCLNAFASGVIPALEGVVTPRRGQMIAFRAPGARLSMSYYLNHGSEYMRQTTDGTIVLGGCRAPFADEEIGCDDKTTRHVQRALDGFAQRFFPDGYEIVARWAGTMGFSPDLLPLIGPVSVDGVEAGRVWFCGGFTGHGMSLATRCAFEAVDAMLENRRPFFPIDRVSAGAAHG